VVRRIIDSYSAPGALVGDAFLGSGTTGIEALRACRRFWGADINPVAVLISRAKCIPIEPESLLESWCELARRLNDVPRVGRRALTAEERAFVTSININNASADQRFAYWFPQLHREALVSLLHQILVVEDEQIRTFFLCAFSNILRRCSIWLSGSTKPQKDLEKALSDPTEAFRSQGRDMLRRNTAYWEDLRLSGSLPDLKVRCELRVEDARDLPLPDGVLDLVVTSPPYATCYNYIDLHQLTQLWFERYDVLPPADLRKVCIGAEARSSRTKAQDTHTSGTGSAVADEALALLAERAEGDAEKYVRREVHALWLYYRDMDIAVRELARVITRGGYLALIIGDSYKRGIVLPTSIALCEMAVAAGLTLERKIVRKVPARVLTSTRDSKTGRFSSTAESDRRAYPEEDILIFRR
jgi:hypothetical protein